MEKEPKLNPPTESTDPPEIYFREDIEQYQRDALNEFYMMAGDVQPIDHLLSIMEIAEQQRGSNITPATNVLLHKEIYGPVFDGWQDVLRVDVLRQITGFDKETSLAIRENQHIKNLRSRIPQIDAAAMKRRVKESESYFANRPSIAMKDFRSPQDKAEVKVIEGTIDRIKHAIYAGRLATSKFVIIEAEPMQATG